MVFDIKRTNGGKARARRSTVRKAGAGKARSTVVSRARGAAIANIRVGGFVGMELKFFDATKGSTAMATAWTSIQPAAGDALSVPAIGTGESQRDGRVFTIRSIFLKGLISMVVSESATAPLDDQTYRLVLVWDTQTNGAAITATDVMDAGATTDVNSFRNLQNSKRFIVLHDTGTRRIARTSQTNEGAVNLFAGPSVFIPWKMNKAFKDGIKVRTIGTTANVTSISDNSIALIGIASSTAVFINYESRCRFTG